MPDASPRVVHVTERTRTVYSALREEIFALGYSVYNHERDLPRLEGSILAWMTYLYRLYPRSWFVNTVVRVYPQDRAFVSLPKELDFLYHVVRLIRLTVKYSTRLVRKLLRS
jgi:hypothetical protein